MVTDEEFRAIGYTGEARNYPRDKFGLIVAAAWNGVEVKDLTPAMHYYPNAHMKMIWERVIDAIRTDSNKINIRAIKTEADYDWAIAEIAQYFDNEPKPGSEDADRFAVLADLIEAYEAKHWAWWDNPDGPGAA